MSNFYIVGQNRSIIDDFGGIIIDWDSKYIEDIYTDGYSIRNKLGWVLGFYYTEEQAQYVFNSIIDKLTARYSNTDDTNRNRIYYMPLADEIKNYFETDKFSVEN